MWMIGPHPWKNTKKLVATIVKIIMATMRYLKMFLIFSLVLFRIEITLSAGSLG